VEGLFFIGLPWQRQRGSALVCGVGRDAEYLLSFIKDALRKAEIDSLEKYIV
jgi:putative flavoprotein involved in K+ transport